MRFGRVLCVVLVILCAASTQADQESRVVRTTSGSVRGYKEDDVYVFYSIPYATAPTGRDKFKAPIPAPMWLETFEAVDKHIVCHQSVVFSLPPTSIYQEDCLIANIFVPDTEETKLPVVVYVHGGAYQVGFGNLLTPKSLVNSKKVIAVTFNYRLGVHGFLCLGTEDVPGNAGMKDQVALLRWVQKNIGKFGGNPNDVTIAGYSAGSSAVDLLMLSKSAKGLFNKVIPESGANIAVWSVQIDPLNIAKEFAISQNFTDVDNIYALEEFYRSAPFEVLTSDNFMSRSDSTVMFSPCVERYISTKTERFLDDAPVNILKNGKYNKVPILYGFANMEGINRVQMGYDLFKDKMNSKFSDFMPADLEFESEAQKQKVAKQVKEFYFGDKAVGDDTILAYIDFFTDVMFAYSTLRAVKYHAEAGHNQVYVYEYSFPDDQIMPETIKAKVRGADHCAQTTAVLDSPPEGSEWAPPENKSEEYKRLRAIMRELWLNFITTGKPVPSESALPAWPPANASGAPYMSLTMPPQLVDGPLLERRTRFWDAIYDKYYRTPVPPPTPPPKMHTEL
ncbi:esterase FE4-like [Hyposmocoma kahamanoa]|uniref:esterase FE4-like n=1 Tax=Hyposmocoma kahamanoa TaxID=1477025 RepID=UPI000E6D8DFD|nr:esterase FE4-like [Hyposmocoma kahamanoa]